MFDNYGERRKGANKIMKLQNDEEGKGVVQVEYSVNNFYVTELKLYMFLHACIC